MPWTLDNAEERARGFPGATPLPPESVRNALQAGDVVKLIFRLKRDDGEGAVERMWVDVVGGPPGGPYEGRLDNEPILKGVLAHGDLITFGPEHVTGYGYTLDELGYDVFGVCYVSATVDGADEPPRWLRVDDEGIWNALAGTEPDAEMDEPICWELGYLADRYPVTQGPLREGGPGGAWWRLEGDRYVRDTP